MRIRQKLWLSFLSVSLVGGLAGAIAVKQGIDAAQAISIREAENLAFVIADTLHFEKSGNPSLFRNVISLQAYTQELHELQKRDIVVVDSQKKILADVVSENVGHQFDHDQNNEIQATIQDGRVRTFVEKSVDYPEGIQQIVVPITLQDGTTIGAVIVEYTQLYEEIMGRAKDTALLALGIVISGMGLAIALGFYISGGLAAPIKQLEEAALDLAQGNIQHRVMIQSNDEMGQLAAVFNQMAKDLEQRITGHQQAELSLRRSEALLKHKNQELEYILQELQQTQLQLIHSEKMSSLGQLVAGIAHEINNPINFIHGNLMHAQAYGQDLLKLLHLYQQQYPDPPRSIQKIQSAIDLEFLSTDMPKLLNSMNTGSQRIREIVKALRVFSRLDEAEIKAVNIHEGIDSILTILHSRLKAKAEYPEIQVIKEYGNLPLVECFAGQLNQVLMNIISNAIDALEEARQKRVSKASTLQRLEDAIAHTSTIHIQTRLIEKDWVEICIRNNGLGISETTKDKLFNPLFTTKPTEKGTGLGLAISYQIIVEKHKGKISCNSSPDWGTEFLIQIPIHQNVFQPI